MSARRAVVGRSHVGSEALFARAQAASPGGVHSNVRLDAPPTFFARGSGAWLWDVDGNDYVDFVLGHGARRSSATRRRRWSRRSRAVGRGSCSPARRPPRSSCRAVPRGRRCAEQVRFGSSGTEMVQAALRLARAATGGQVILKFEGHYHGWLDTVSSVAPPRGPARRRADAAPAERGQPRDGRECDVLPWNDTAALRRRPRRARRERIAAVIMEPIMCNTGGSCRAPGILETVRE